jgi:hypothetical protein
MLFTTLLLATSDHQTTEVYEGRFAAALLMDEMRRPWPDVLDALSRLHEWRPTKVSRGLRRVNHQHRKVPAICIIRSGTV